MKYTLLDIVQDILSSIDGDEVNSIGDTTESLQITKLVRDRYFDIMSRSNLPEHYTLFNLNASADITKPTIMYTPSNINEVCWVKYDVHLDSEDRTRFQVMEYIEPEEFMIRMHSLNTDDTNVISFTHQVGVDGSSLGGTFSFLVHNNLGPTYYTALSDNTLVFNSYDSAVDNTLQASKTMCYGQLIPSWEMVDDFIPTLDDQQFPLLINECKSWAWAELKQSQHIKAEQGAKRNWTTLNRTKTKVPGYKGYWEYTPHFGRKY